MTPLHNLLSHTHDHTHCPTPLSRALSPTRTVSPPTPPSPPTLTRLVLIQQKHFGERGVVHWRSGGHLGHARVAAQTQFLDVVRTMKMFSQMCMRHMVHIILGIVVLGK